MTYEELQIRGTEATQRVGGIDRGGIVFQGVFHYPAAVNLGTLSVPAKDWVPSVDYNANSFQ